MGDADDQIYGKINQDMDPFKRILSKIPGFSGYVERQNRRDADKILREALASRIEEQWQRVSRLQKEFINQGEIAYVDDLESSAIKMRTFADRVRRASRGYAGVFDAIKINQEELQQIYTYDAAMLDLVDQISSAIDNVGASIGTDGLPAAIRHLTTITQQCIEIYNRRDEIITGTAAA